jgi:magnesium transporter
MLSRYRIRESTIQEDEGEDANLLLCVAPTETERTYLVSQLGIDEHTLQSAMDPDEISRLEFETTHVAMIFKRPKNYSAEDQFVFKVASIGFFWFPERLVLVAPADFSLHEGRPITRITTNHDLVLRIIERTITQYLGHLRTINMVADSLEQKVNRSMENKYLLNLFALEKGMVYYQNAIHSNGIVIDKLRTAAGRIGFSPENVQLLEDLAIENQQCYKQTEIYSTIFASLMDARVTVVGNNLAQLIKSLNIITIGIMVPTLVVSVFSMNLALPLGGQPGAFWYVLGLAGIADLIFLLIWGIASRR